jgi:choline-sulfatase
MLIGKMVDALKETGQFDNTVIIYFADHGEMLGEHGMWSKCCLLEQSVCIPMIVSYPEKLLQNHRVPQCVNTVDLTRTILELANVDQENIQLANPDGRNLLPLLTQEHPYWQDEVFSEYYANHSYAPMAMLRRGRYKLNYYYDEEPELYDLKKDPGEFINLANDPDMQSIRKSMEEALLRRWHPARIENRVIQSQKTRDYLKSYLFSYIAKERKKWSEKFTRDLNKRPE